MKRILAAAALLCLPIAAPLALAQDPPAIPLPAASPWPGGTMSIDVDATDIARGVFKVTQAIPVAPGTRSLTLLYPEWEPGHHAPRGPLSQLVDLRFSVDGQPVAWRRDPINLYAFHLTLPEGAREVVARFMHTPPLQPSEGKVMIAPEMLDLQWEHASLYPAGHNVQRIRVRPSATFPEGWYSATALDGAATSGNRTTWAETDYETLVDSPVLAGLYSRRWILGNGIALSGFGQRPELLNARIEDMAKLVALGEEALALFGPAPFDRYEFLVAITNTVGISGSSTAVPPRSGWNRAISATGRSSTGTATSLLTNWSTPGTASTACRPGWRRRISASRCRATCCGFTKGRPSSGAMSWRRDLASRARMWCWA